MTQTDMEQAITEFLGSDGITDQEKIELLEELNTI